jgi:hypothetical protein
MYQLSIKDDFKLVFKTYTRLIDLTRWTNANENQTKVYNQDTFGAIYAAKCKLCQNPEQPGIYVGETGRKLGDRIAEHCRKIKTEDVGKLSTSAIAEHSIKSHGTQPSIEMWDFEVLDTSRRTQDRKTLEALYIMRIRPSLNRDKGVHVINTVAVK